MLPKTLKTPRCSRIRMTKGQKVDSLCARSYLQFDFPNFPPYAGIKTFIRLNVTECIISPPPAPREQQKHHLRLCTFEKMWRRRRRWLLMLSCHLFNVTQICCLKARNPLSVCVPLGEGRQSVSVRGVGCASRTYFTQFCSFPCFLAL